MDYETAVLELYPGTGTEYPLRNLYRDLPLEPPGHPGGIFIYSNFVTSLDGRIAVSAPGASGVPDAIANPRDWRLFQELAARADVLITSGRYLRQLAARTAQDVLPLGEAADFADLRDWRIHAGLRPQPDVAVVSPSLDFELPSLLLEQGRRVLVFTTKQAPAARLAELEAGGAELLDCAPHELLSGAAVAEGLERAGYRRAYSVAGPRILHTLVDAGVLDTLFLSVALRLLGGERYDTLLEGTLLNPPASLALRSLFFDRHAPAGAGQLLACFDRR